MHLSPLCMLHPRKDTLFHVISDRRLLSCAVRPSRGHPSGIRPHLTWLNCSHLIETAYTVQPIKPANFEKDLKITVSFCLLNIFLHNLQTPSHKTRYIPQNEIYWKSCHRLPSFPAPYNLSPLESKINYLDLMTLFL